MSTFRVEHTNTRMHMTHKISILLILFLVHGSQLFAQKDKQVKAETRISEALGYIDYYYVDDVDAQQLANEAIIAMLEKLDPHSVYIPKEEVEDANQQINGSFVGIGVRFQIMKDTLMVVNPIPGGPSEKLGIRAGDLIIAIDGENVAGVGIKNNDVRNKLMGELGSKVMVTIKRKNENALVEYTIKRDKIPVNSVVASYMIDERIGYIKLTSFSKTTVEEVKKSIKDLKDKGMQDLIFDLQGNGGGLLYAAKVVADEFLDKNKLIVYSEGRRQPRQEYLADEKGLFEKGRLVILIDESSASASEILSGAIQDWDRGLIVGRRSFGKGLVQRPIDLSDGGQMRLTIARYYTPSGRFIQRPYEDHDEYEKDRVNRYLRGEYMHKDSIKLPDSLLYQTKVTKREVYGGGGIMPDVFVSMDTSGITPYFRTIARKGYMNSFAIAYVNDNRAQLKSTYPNFEAYKTNWETNYGSVETAFLDYVKNENPELEFNEEEFKESRELIKLRIAGFIAQNIWDYEQFWEIYNQTNEVLQRAVEVLRNKEYDKVKLARH
jgi:carboxyl-terminal processing protease